MINNVIMPKQGLQMTEGVIIKWFFGEGDSVKAGQPLFQMETDKLTIDIDSQFDGTLLKIVAQEGETVPITETIAYIGDAGEAIPDSPAHTAAPTQPSAPVISETPAAAPQPVELPQAAPVKAIPSGRVFITPRARTRAAELEIDYKKAAAKGRLTGSGRDGIIIERDILAYKPEAVPAYSPCAFHTAEADATEAITLCASLKAIGVEADIFTFAAFAMSKAFEAPVGEARFGDTGYTVSVAVSDKAYAAFTAALRDSDDGDAEYAAADFTKQKVSSSMLPLADGMTAILCVALSKSRVSLTLTYDYTKLNALKAAESLGKAAFMLENPRLTLAL